ncbi:hypothetical protein [Epibacterium ulvae]|uniref:hypothetical protein n=1 Tax=Epibacterium ulvae TaxID=1156985 RepID=UPI00249012DB|nr:hypothetical protein [Epibacterium ulvae]
MVQQFTRNGSTPAPLPFRITLSDGRTRTDAQTFTAEEIADAGYTAAPDMPEYDPASQQMGWDGAGWRVEDLPPQPVSYRALTRIEFVRLCRSAGGMTGAQLVQARETGELKEMWIMLEMAVQVQRGDPEVEPGLAALAALGFLPNGAQAVLDAWPTS